MKPRQWHLYQCSRCKISVPRLSDKQWIVSYCEKAGCYARFYMVKPASKKP